MSDVQQKLSSLAAVSQAITLGVTIEGVVVPFLIATIKDIKGAFDTGETMDYTVVLSVGKDNLAAADANFDEIIRSVNAELARMGKPTI